MPSITLSKFRSRKAVKEEKHRSGSFGGCVSVEELAAYHQVEDDFRPPNSSRRSRSQIDTKGLFSKRTFSFKSPNASTSTFHTARNDSSVDGPLRTDSALDDDATRLEKSISLSQYKRAPSPLPRSTSANDVPARPKTADASIHHRRLRGAASLSTFPPVPWQPKPIERSDEPSQHPTLEEQVEPRSPGRPTSAASALSGPGAPWMRRNKSEASVPLIDSPAALKYSLIPSLETQTNRLSSRAGASNARSNEQIADLPTRGQPPSHIASAATSPRKKRPSDVAKVIKSSEPGIQAPTAVAAPKAAAADDVTFSATITQFGGSDMSWDTFDPSYYDVSDSPEGSVNGDTYAEKEVVVDAPVDDSMQTADNTHYVAELDSTQISNPSTDEKSDVKGLEAGVISKDTKAVNDVQTSRTSEDETNRPKTAGQDQMGLGLSFMQSPSLVLPPTQSERKGEHATKASLKDARLKILSLNLSQSPGEPSLEQFARELMDRLSPTSAEFLARNMALPSPNPSELAATPITPKTSHIPSPLYTATETSRFLKVEEPRNVTPSTPRSFTFNMEETTIDTIMRQAKQETTGPAISQVSKNQNTELTSGKDAHDGAQASMRQADSRSASPVEIGSGSFKNKSDSQTTSAKPALAAGSLELGASIEAAKSQSRHAKPSDQYTTTLQADLDTQKEKNAALKADNDALRTQLTTALKRMAQIDATRLERDRAEKQHREAKARLATVNEEFMTLKASNQVTLNKYEAMQARMDEAFEQKLDVLEENHLLHTKVKMMKAQTTVKDDLPGSPLFESLAVQVRERDEKLADLTTQLTALQSEAEDLRQRPEKAALESSESKVRGLIQQIAALEEITTELMQRPEKKTFDALERKSKTLYDRNKVLSEEKTIIKEQFVRLEAQIVKLESKPDLSFTVSDLRSRLALIELDVKERSSQILGLQMQKVQLEQAVTAAEIEAASAVGVMRAAAIVANRQKPRSRMVDKSTETEAIPEVSRTEPIEPGVTATPAGVGRKPTIDDARKQVKRLRAERDKFQLLLHAEFRRNAIENFERKHPMNERVAKKLDLDAAVKGLRERAEISIEKQKPGSLPPVAVKEVSAKSNHILSQLATAEGSTQPQKEMVQKLEAEILYYLTDIVLFKLDVRGYKKDLKKAQDKIKQLVSSRDGIVRNDAGEEAFEMPAMPLTPERRRSFDDAPASAESLRDRVQAKAAVSSTEGTIASSSQPSSVADGESVKGSISYPAPFGPPLNSPTFSVSTLGQRSSASTRKGSLASVVAPSDLTTHATETDKTSLETRPSTTTGTDVAQIAVYKPIERNDRNFLPSQSNVKKEERPVHVTVIRPSGLRKAGSLDEIVSNPTHVRSTSGSAKSIGLTINPGTRSGVASAVTIGSPLSMVSSANSPSTDGGYDTSTPIVSPLNSASLYGAENDTNSEHRIVSQVSVLTPPMTHPNTPDLNRKASNASLTSVEDEMLEAGLEIVESREPYAVATASAVQIAKPVYIRSASRDFTRSPTPTNTVTIPPSTRQPQQQSPPAPAPLPKDTSKDAVRQVRDLQRARMQRSNSPSPLRSHPAMQMAEKPGSPDLGQRAAQANGEEIGRASQETSSTERSGIGEMMTVGFDVEDVVSPS